MLKQRVKTFSYRPYENYLLYEKTTKWILRPSLRLNWLFLSMCHLHSWRLQQIPIKS